MMSRLSFSSLVIFFCVSITAAFAQNNIAINNTGNPPDSSAMLDIQSTTKGVLVPRMNSTQRTMINNAAPGLLVYDMDSESFWFKDTQGWTELVSGSRGMRDADQDTRVEVEATPDEDTIRFTIAGSELVKMDNKTLHLEAAAGSMYIGTQAGNSDNTNLAFNTAMGFEALKSNAMGTGNTAIGYQSLKAHNSEQSLTAVGYKALSSNTSGGENSALGYRALKSNSTGTSNSAFGYDALTLNVDGDYNTAVGYNVLTYNTSFSNTGIGSHALQDNSIGNSNVAVGQTALFRNTEGNYNVGVGAESNMLNYTGSNNVMLGYQAGRGTIGHSKSGNVFIGYQAGYNATGDNKLYIDNSNTSSPLIYGDFSANTVGINGNLGIGTQAPAHPLHVIKDGTDSVQTIVGMLQSITSARPVLLFSENSTNGFASGMSIEYNGAAGFGDSNEMYINKTGGQSMVTFENSGDVGIATTNPATKLHVEGGSDSGLGGGGFLTLGAISDKNLSFDNNEIMARNNGAAADLFLQVDGGGISVGTSTNDSKLNIESAAGENPLRARVETATKFLVHSNGGAAIGVNATPPTNGLHVQGNIYMNGTEVESSDTLRLKSTTRIELIVGASSIVIDPVSGITITSDSDINFIAGDRIDLDAGTELELNSGTNMDLNATGNFNLNSDAMIDLDAGTELELNSGTTMDINATGILDIDGSSTIEIDSPGTVDIDGSFVRLETEGNPSAGAARIGSNVSVPGCTTGCNGTVNTGSPTVLIGY